VAGGVPLAGKARAQAAAPNSLRPTLTSGPQRRARLAASRRVRKAGERRWPSPSIRLRGLKAGIRRRAASRRRHVLPEPPSCRRLSG
jgi:hypothetical protein